MYCISKWSVPLYNGNNNFNNSYYYYEFFTLKHWTIICMFYMYILCICMYTCICIYIYILWPVMCAKPHLTMIHFDCNCLRNIKKYAKEAIRSLMCLQCCICGFFILFLFFINISIIDILDMTVHWIWVIIINCILSQLWFCKWWIMLIVGIFTLL